MQSNRLGSLLVSRPNQNFAKLRAYSVLLDDTRIGRIKNGETAEFSVEPGSHYVQYKMGFSKSKPLQIQVHQGETAKLVIEKDAPSPLKYWSALVVLGLCAALSATLPPYSLLVWGIGAFVYSKLNGKPYIRVLER